MPLKAPDIDSRSFEEILASLRLRISRYTPEWTDFNDSDPGMVLVQLFAWLTETLTYQMNQVPDRAYIKLLELLGLELRPAQAAMAHLTFLAQPAAPAATVRRGSQIGAEVPGADAPVVFEVDTDLDLVRVPLTDVQVLDSGGFTVVTAANDPGDPTIRVLGWVPQVGNALYLGFGADKDEPPPRLPVFPSRLAVRFFRPPPTGVEAESCEWRRQAPPPPVDLVWEYKPKRKAAHWSRLQVHQDESAAFTREGTLWLAGPGEIEKSQEGRVAGPRYWLRCRLAAGAYPAGAAPEIDFIRANTVSARQLSTVRDEVVGTSDGGPSQAFALRRKPVERDSLELWTEQAGTDESWERVDDLLGSRPLERHFVLNANTGAIRFGDGQRGRIPLAGAQIVARRYRYGGGLQGNVAPQQIAALLTSIPGVKSVVNERPAVGGRDEQAQEEFLRLAPRALRMRDRAVTADDFTTLASMAGGVAKATALPQVHPDHPGVAVPGAITVVIVPDNDDLPPRPSPDLLREVCRYLDQFRLIGTELYVTAPDYKCISVEARVAAKPYASPDRVRQEVVVALDQYLHPVGRRDESGAKAREGFGFGAELYPTSLYGVIVAVPDVEAVLNLRVFVNGVEHEDVRAFVKIPPGGLVYGAGHDITVEPARDR